MKKDTKINCYARLKCLRDRTPINRPSNGHELFKKRDELSNHPNQNARMFLHMKDGLIPFLLVLSQKPTNLYTFLFPYCHAFGGVGIVAMQLENLIFQCDYRAQSQTFCRNVGGAEAPKEKTKMDV